MPATIHSTHWRLVCVILLPLIVPGCSRQAEPPPVTEVMEHEPQPSPYVVVYSAMSEAQLQPVLDSYTVETGERVHVEYADAATLIERMADKRRTPLADLFIADSVANLVNAVEADQFRPTRSEVLDENIFPIWRDPENLWFGLTARVRVFVYRTDAVDRETASGLTDYGAVGAEEWRGRLCLSSSSVRGNQSLIAMLITMLGVRDAELVVRGWRANLAIPPLNDDAELIQALADGRCDLGMVASHLAVRAAREVVELDVAWPSVKHNMAVDISGAGVTRHAANPERAQALLEWLSGESPNALVAALALEFPANLRAPVDQQLTHPGGAYLEEVAGFGYLQEEARLLAERARYP